jgi:hypothetical protein
MRLVGLGALLCVLTPAVVGAVPRSLSANSPTDRALIALHFAPIHYQDVDSSGDHSLGGYADYITRFDFDGDLNARNNWENLAKLRGAPPSAAYYSVVESKTHWFIVYLFFHPRDWTDGFFDTEHENDAEGVLLAVRRDGSTFGQLKGAVTVAHRDFYSYVPRGSDWSAGLESIDGVLTQKQYDGSLHPETAQESQGHGLKARPYYDIENEDGIVYYPSLAEGKVAIGPRSSSRFYQLIDIFEPNGMWDNRNNAELFGSFGSFAGNTGGACGSFALGCTTNSAHAPWAWDDSDDECRAGAMAFDPAGLVKSYFRTPESLNLMYEFNPYVRDLPALVAVATRESFRRN